MIVRRFRPHRADEDVDPDDFWQAQAGVGVGSVQQLTEAPTSRRKPKVRRRLRMGFYPPDADHYEDVTD